MSVLLSVVVAVPAFLASAARADVPLATYIVTFDGPPNGDQLDVLSGVALSVHGFRHLPAAVAVADPADAGLLANLPGVRRVYPNRSLVKLLRESTRTIRADQVWNLGYDGTGIGIAVIDTGIDGSHPDLCAAATFCRGTPVKTVQNVKFIGRQDLGVDPIVVLEDQINTDTTSGHGSHVAGIAAGLGVASAYETGKYRGVAPGARLIGLGTGELLSVDNVLAAYDWVIEHKDDPRYNIKVINNSWGPGAGTPYDPEDPVQRATVAAHDAGLSVVFGAGNDGPTTDTLNAFSVNPDAISVAGGAKDGNIAFFSSRGVPGNALWRPTVTAPGYLITSVRASTGFVTDVYDVASPNTSDPILPPDNVYYATGNGTSMASPHVAGVVALMQQASFQARARYLTPDEVKNILQNTAVSGDPSRGPGGLPNYQRYSMGAGYVDALTSVKAAAAGAATQPYADPAAYDVRTFAGQVGPAAFFATDSLTSTFHVGPGAVSLDVMIDWAQKANGIDLDLYDPSGALVRSTFLLCNPGAEPNGYSWFCTQVPNERVTVVGPVPGDWRAVAHGTLSAVDTVQGVWSAAYPAGTVLATQNPASVTVAPAAPASVTGQSVQVVATVRDASGNAIVNAPVTWSSAGAGSIIFGETATHADGTATASVSSSSPGTETVAAASGAASGSAQITWLGVSLPGSQASTPGRASGGGWFLDPGKRTFGFWAEYDAGAAAPSGELSFDDHAGSKVKATGIEWIVIDGSRATVQGPATLNGASGYHVRIEVVDNGSPGRNDTFHLTLTKDLDPLFAYQTGGTLGGGNVVVAAG